jgi:hypothetical protein
MRGEIDVLEPRPSLAYCSLDDRAIGVRSPAEVRDFSSNLCVQTGSGAHPASCPMGTGGPFPGGKARPWHDPDHSPHLVQRSWMSRSYTSSPPLRFNRCVVDCFMLLRCTCVFIWEAAIIWQMFIPFNFMIRSKGRVRTCNSLNSDHEGMQAGSAWHTLEALSRAGLQLQALRPSGQEAVAMSNPSHSPCCDQPNNTGHRFPNVYGLRPPPQGICTTWRTI